MFAIKNVAAIDEVVVLPIVIITFILLTYMVVYLWKKDENIIKARIFLRYDEFKKAFLLFELFALVLLLHTLLIYRPHIFYDVLNCTSTFANELQRDLGLILVLIMMSFVYMVHKSIK